MKAHIHYSDLAPRWGKVIAIAFLTLVPSFASGQAQEDTVLQFYTHGETMLAQKAGSAPLSGHSIDLLACAMDHVGRPYTWSIAPLSRAKLLLASDQPVIWFPSLFSGDDERLSRLVGPAGSVAFYWHIAKDYNLDPSSDEFKNQAKVSAYRGSRLEKWLQDNDYQFIQGSAQPERLAFQLLSGEVDAILSVDLSVNMPEATKNEIETKTKKIVHSHFEAAFEVSPGLKNSDPKFVDNFQSALNTCSDED